MTGKKMVGDDENNDLEMTYSQDSGLDVFSHEHGKVNYYLQWLIGGGWGGW